MEPCKTVDGLLLDRWGIHTIKNGNAIFYLISRSKV